MTDQAQTLRSMSGEAPNLASETRVIAITSGKGGVGKTSLVANLSLLFGQMGRRVLTIDGDLGLANLDIALGLQTRGNVLDVLEGTRKIDDVLSYASDSVAVLPACSGRYELANLSDRDRYGLFSAIDSLEERFDLALIDTAAGIGSNAVAFSGAAQSVVLVATPDPTSLADAYACVKVLNQRHDIKRIRLVANMVRTPAEAEEIHQRIATLVDRFLNVAVDYLGYVPRDSALNRSLRACTPVVLEAPKAASSQALAEIARRLLAEPADETNGGIQLFWKKVLGWR
ncbi:MAG: MinD/ParA family protein, partial [Myxococcota bacterium]